MSRKLALTGSFTIFKIASPRVSKVVPTGIGNSSTKKRILLSIYCCNLPSFQYMELSNFLHLELVVRTLQFLLGILCDKCFYANFALISSFATLHSMLVPPYHNFPSSFVGLFSPLNVESSLYFIWNVLFVLTTWELLCFFWFFVFVIPLN